MPLPDEWAHTPFRVRDALARDIPISRLSAPPLQALFNTVRSPGDRIDAARVATAFALRQGPDQVVSHTTALLLWGAPLPRRVEQQHTIHVSSVGGSRPRTQRTEPHLLSPGRTPVTHLDGLAITEPAVSWVQSAPLLSLEDLVAAGDFLVTGTEPFDGSPPLIRMSQLADAVRLQWGARGIRRAREALGLVRYGSLSRRESFTRLMLHRGGLPEPHLNHHVPDRAGGTVAMVDLAYPEYRVAVEFESLLHLDPGKFRRDIRKQQRLADADWFTHRLTSDDVDSRLRTPASRSTLSRIRRSLLTRGWNPRE